MAADVQILEVRVIGVPDVHILAGQPLQVVVVGNHQDAVLGLTHVDFHVIRADFNGLLQSRRRIFRCIRRIPAVAGDQGPLGQDGAGIGVVNGG